MSISKTPDMCEVDDVNTARQGWQTCLVTLMLAAIGFSAVAQNTNISASTNVPTPATPAQASPAQTASTQALPAQVASGPSRDSSIASRLDDSEFRTISERNIFNANRSGGQVRLSARQPARVESFTLVGTMAYAKGAFAFFDGTSSEFTKVLKTDGVIAGHKLVDILTDAVKLEADGKIVELPIGSGMRREDEGAWQEGESLASRSNSTPTSTASSADQSEILKRLMERREKDSQ
jgi:hypothetical protein